MRGLRQCAAYRLKLHGVLLILAGGVGAEKYLTKRP